MKRNCFISSRLVGQSGYTTYQYTESQGGVGCPCHPHQPLPYPPCWLCRVCPQTTSEALVSKITQCFPLMYLPDRFTSFPFNVRALVKGYIYFDILEIKPAIHITIFLEWRVWLLITPYLSLQKLKNSSSFLKIGIWKSRFHGCEASDIWHLNRVFS